MKKCIPLSKKLIVWSIPVFLAVVFAGCTVFQPPAEEEQPKEPMVNNELSVTENKGDIVKFDPDKQAEEADVAEEEGSDEDIILGPVQNNADELDGLQAKIDEEEKEEWRTDPEQVLIASKEDYGFYPKDKYALVQMTDPESGQSEKAAFAIQHGQESYIAVLAKAFPDKENSIWVWTSIKKNKQ
ncbi:hypothetical protein ACFL0Z_01785 [Patescibacteria group bacterium]